MDGMTPPNRHSENELITEVEADFGEVVLLDGVKSLKSVTRFSNELAGSSVVALEGRLRVLQPVVAGAQHQSHLDVATPALFDDLEVEVVRGDR